MLAFLALLGGWARVVVGDVDRHNSPPLVIAQGVVEES